jgi:hypothetical protein
MYQIREVFKTKPGKAKELVSIFKKTAQFMEKEGYSNIKIMTDLVMDYWTVVIELETDNLNTFLSELRSSPHEEQVREIMKGYMDLVTGGHREIYKIE